MTMELLKEVAEALRLSDEFVEGKDSEELKSHCLKLIKKLKQDMDMHSVPLNQWVVVEKDKFPPPSTDVTKDTKSPIVQHLFASWSGDAEKRDYIEDWLRDLSKQDNELPADFPYGLQIVAVDAVLRDAFLSILIPIIEAVNHRPEPKYVVYTRRRYRPINRDEETTTMRDFSYDIRIKIPRSEADAPPERASSISEWWESEMSPNLKSFGENIIQSPLAQIVSILPPGLTGGLNTSTASDDPDENEQTAEEKATREAEEEKRREEDRRWSSQISNSEMDRQRARSTDGGTGGIGPDDQAPHKAVRGSEAAIFEEYDAPLKREADAISGLVDPAMVQGAAAAAPAAEHKKSIIEAKLAKLREGRKGAIA